MAMLTSLLVLQLVSFGSSLTISPRQNKNVTPPTPVNGTGTGLEYATACIQSKHSWAEDRGTKFASTTILITSATWSNVDHFATYDTVTSLENATEYTLCDKWPRIDGTTSTIKRPDDRTTTWTSSYITTVSVFTSYPAPNCTISKPDCDILQTSWTSAESAYDAVLSSYESYTSSARSAGVTPTVRYPQRSYLSPICGSPLPVSTITAVGPPGCAVDRATVQLLYWPVVRQTGDLCNNNASLSTLGPTISGKPNTAVYEGTTLTSPTVYVALDGTWRVESSGTTYNEHSRLILPQKPADVSSVCGILGGGYSSHAVNYADFNGDVPGSAYRCQPRCNTHPYAPKYTTTFTVDTAFTLGNVTVPESTRTVLLDDWDATRDGFATENLCSTIWNDYRPALSIPPEFSSMNPAQNMSGFHCEFVFSNDSIFYDPPKALIPAASIVKPTNPAGTPDDPPYTAQPTPDPGSKPKPTTPRVTKLPSVETDKPNAPVEPSQQPDPGPGKSDVPAEPSPRPDPGTDKPDVPGEPSQQPGPGTNAPGLPEQPPQPPNEPPKPTNTASRSGHEEDPAHDTTVEPSSTQPHVTHNNQSGPTATGVVITASNGQQVTAIQTLPAGPVVVGGATLTPGQTTHYEGIGGIVVGSNGLSVDATYHTFTAFGHATASGAVLTDDAGREITVQQGSVSGAVVIGSATLSAGQSTSIPGVGNAVVGPDGLVVDGKLAPFSALDATTTNGAYVVAGVTFAAHDTSAISLGPEVTLRPGGPAVSFSGHIVSMAASGAYIVVDGTTQQATPMETPAPALDIGGTIYTANQASDFVLDGTTLTQGGAVVVGGTTVSLDASGQYVVVNGVTQSISPPAPATAATTSDTNTDGRATEISTASASDEPAALASSAHSLTQPWSRVKLLVAVLCISYLF